jgi:hypothetical protein
MNFEIMKFQKLLSCCLVGFCLLLGILRVNAAEQTDSIPKMKVHYQFSLNANYSKNTAVQFLAVTNNAVSFQKGRSGFSQLLNYQYSTLKASPSSITVNLLNETQLTSRFDYTIKRFKPFGLFGFERSNIRTIKNRLYGIAGMDYGLITKKNSNVSPLIGLCSESTDYLDNSKIDYYSLVFGLRGFHNDTRNKSRINYFGYFFKSMATSQWRYQLTLTGMIKIVKSLYGTVNLNALQENIFNQDISQPITSISFGLTFTN